jgi:glycosyltransferase involved in cell wall biosynthesis
MITYNHEAYIEKAIRSVMMQKADFKFQLVIGEDCSLDGTNKICQKLHSEFGDKIKLLPSQKNIGMMPNFIRTLMSCDQKYIAICDGDDYWTDPYKLQKQVDFLEGNSEYSICAHNTVMYAENTKEFIETPMSDQDHSLNQFILGTIIGRSASSIVFRMDEWVKNKIGSDDFLNGAGGDWMLTIILLQRGKMKYFGEAMGIYRLHDQGVYSGQQRIKQLEMYLKTAKSVDALSEGKYKVPIRNRSIRNVIALIRRSTKDSEKFHDLWDLYHSIDKPPHLKRLESIKSWQWFWRSSISKLVYLLVPIHLK